MLSKKNTPRAYGGFFIHTLRITLFQRACKPRIRLYHIQVSSLYKMRSHFFVPIPSIEASTGPNWMKFCMGPPKGITRVITEGFLDIRSMGPDMGYPLGAGRGAKNFENLFSIFLFFSTGMAFRRSKSLVKVIIGPSCGHFGLFGPSRLQMV